MHQPITIRMTRWSKRMWQSPARLSIASFAVLILIGTVLLMLPASSTGRSVGFVDALFTSASAACVTGLVVLDTGSDFSVFGQFVILMLIQTGGLGIMTLSTIFMIIAGGRLSIKGHEIIMDTYTLGREQHPMTVLKDIIRFTLWIEGIGMLILFLRFVVDYDAGKALYLSVFHSVSAFCNAGFSPFPDSFMSYRGDGVLNVVLSVLIICGGAGFVVLSEIRWMMSQRQKKQLYRSAWRSLSLHSKIVISSSLLLTVVGTLLIAIMEWDNTLAGAPVFERLLAAFFQSVNTRTSGFNSIAMIELSDQSLFVMIVLMFIGASPGSCAGGIKTTTFFTLTMMGAAALIGKERPQIFCRTIPQISVWKAMTITTISIGIVAAGTMILLVSEVGDVAHTQAKGTFIELLFEVVSAFGTVGLSTGITGTLTTLGKIVIVGIMFIGRLGPMVVAIAISRQKQTGFYYAEENIMIG